MLVVANVVHYILFRILHRQESISHPRGWGLQKHLGKPARAIFFLTCLLMILPTIPDLPSNFEAMLRQAFIMLLVVALGWFAIGCIYVLQAILLRRYDLSAENNIQARRVHTQFQLFRRMLITFVVVVDIGALLWTFNDPRIWHYGSGLLASAGIASLIVATAAKSTASNFFAGLQIAFTEPIRIDDVVVVQGEWGRIEEINSAYVIIKIWDLRRLVVPLSYFIENSFQNWTRQSSDILGTAFLYVDYSIPVEDLRKQLEGDRSSFAAVGQTGLRPPGHQPHRPLHGAALPHEFPQLQRELRPALLRSRENDCLDPGELPRRIPHDALHRPLPNHVCPD